MTTIELQLDEKTLELARRVAELRHSTLEAIIREIIERLAFAAIQDDPVVGMFAQEPELMDQATESAMTARERDLLRQSSGPSPA
jgi:hypothetical protein